VNFGAGMVVGKVASQSPTRQGIAVGVLTTVAFVAFALSGIRPPGSGRSGGSGAIPPLVFLFPVLWICAPALGAKVVGGWRVRRGTSGDAGEFAAVVDDKSSAAGKP
jgi:hypothetical protein